MITSNKNSTSRGYMKYEYLKIWITRIKHDKNSRCIILGMVIYIDIESYGYHHDSFQDNK